MEGVFSENDNDQIFRLMANYKVDKPIKISYIFEDDDSNETNIVKNPQLPDNPAQNTSLENKSNSHSATKLINRTSSDPNCCYSSVSFDDMENGFNIENERRKNAEENYNRSLQDQHTVNSYPISNRNSPSREIEKVAGRMLNLNDLNNMTSNEKMQYLNLLDTVSENVIIIANNYHYYNSQYMKNPDQNIRQYYLDYKLHYYNQSYSVIVAVILPQEHNHVFIRNFINRTIEIANRKSRFHNNEYTQSLVPIILDMIRWAKQKKEYSEARVNQSQYIKSRPPMVAVPPPPYNTSSINKSRPPAVAVPPPPYNTSSVNIRQPMNIQASASLRPVLPSAPYSLSNDIQQQISGPPVSHLPFNLPVQTPSYRICNNSTRPPMRRPPPVSVPPSASPLSSASNSVSNANIPQPKNRLPSVSHALSDLRVPLSPSFSNSNLNTGQPTKILSPGSLIPSVLPEPQTLYKASNVNKRQPMSRTSVNELPVTSVANSITNSKANEKTPGGQDNTICLFSTGSPGSEISISIDAAIAEILNDFKSGNKVCKTSDNRAKKKRKTANDIENSTLLSKSSTWIPPMQNQFQGNNHNCHSANQPPITSKPECVSTKSSTLLSTSSTWIPPMQNQFQGNNHNCHSANQPPITSKPECVSTKSSTLLSTSSTWIAPMQNQLQGNNHNSTTNNPMINTNQLCPGERQNHKDYDNNEYHPLILRSESRDSGFGSPILSTMLSTNDNDTVYPHGTDNQEFTPEITHVTSMNPDAVFIASGACKICGTTTRNKCIACYKVYYCGTKCQTADWALHMHECKSENV